MDPSQESNLLFKVDHGFGVEEYSLQRLEEVFGFHYTPDLLFRNDGAKEWVKSKCLEAYENGQIDEMRIWLGQQHSRPLLQEHCPDLTIKKISPEVGYGVLTNRPILQWHYIGEYTGLVKRWNFVTDYANGYCFTYAKDLLSLQGYVIDAKNYGGIVRFINHSDTPNLEANSIYSNGFFHITLRALKDIAPGEELSYDYGKIYWSGRKKV